MTEKGFLNCQQMYKEIFSYDKFIGRLRNRILEKPRLKRKKRHLRVITLTSAHLKAC